MKDMGEAGVILAIKLIRSTDGIVISQHHYVEKGTNVPEGTVSLVIHYGRFPVVLDGYSDASWIAKNSGSNRCSGYVFTSVGGAVS
ncbi:UNVERIFIED_CONTAM: hypothetical protein Sradi_3192900 [Sesamum radiatum]|uniref:Uncharacterized protein n=1 Tax=Sesamum radiatum TaxID=300843 RepID=A0AAW2RFR8_SESRA